MIIALPQSPQFYRVVNLVLAAFLAWFAAGLIWLMLSPRPTPPVASPAIAHRTLAQLDTSPLAIMFTESAAPAIAPSTLNLKLRGVIAAHDNAPAVAVFDRASPPSIAVKLGDDIDAGVKLIEVAPDHVMVDNHGRHERIDLENPMAGAAGIFTPAGPRPGGPIATEFTPPPVPPRMGSHRGAPGRQPGGMQRSLSREALSENMQHLNVTDWARGLADGSSATPGIVVQDATAQPLSNLLGLQSGDVLRAVNGNNLQRTADISNLYSAFGNASSVTVDILRNGMPMSLHYRIENPPAP